MIIAAIILLVSFLIINVILAFIDSRIIQSKKGIRHWINGLIYCVLVGASYLWIVRDEWLAVSLFIERLIFFQISLSLFRSLIWNYITAAPKSITDRIQVAVFGHNGKLMYSIYAVLFIVNLIIIFL